MPTFNGVCSSITRKDGTSLDEYGTQVFPQNGRAVVFIESSPGDQFDINVETICPTLATAQSGHSLLASVYLDGCRQVESSVILKQNNEGVSMYAKLTGRRANAENGKFVHQNWIFKECSVETLFERMLIAEETPYPPMVVPIAEELSHLHVLDTPSMSNQLALETGNPIRKTSARIELHIHKIRLFKRWVSSEIHLPHTYKAKTNTTGLVNGKMPYSIGYTQPTKAVEKLEFQAWDYLKPGQSPMCVITFLYRPRAVLRNLSLIGTDEGTLATWGSLRVPGPTSRLEPLPKRKFDLTTDLSESLANGEARVFSLPIRKRVACSPKVSSASVSGTNYPVSDTTSPNLAAWSASASESGSRMPEIALSFSEVWNDDTTGANSPVSETATSNPDISRIAISELNSPVSDAAPSNLTVWREAVSNSPLPDTAPSDQVVWTVTVPDSPLTDTSSSDNEFRSATSSRAGFTPLEITPSSSDASDSLSALTGALKISDDSPRIEKYDAQEDLDRGMTALARLTSWFANLRKWEL